MKRTVVALCAIGACAFGTVAEAGVYTDDMARCLVKSTSVSDQGKLMRWVFFALSAHPAIRDEAHVSDQVRSSAAQVAAEMMQRLMTVDCRKETVAAIRFEGGGAVERAFQVLGEAATRGLMTDPAVGAGLAELQTYVDAARFESLAREAGLTPPTK